MKVILVAVFVLAVGVVSAIPFDVSSQFQKQDGYGGYAYGYHEPNSKKHEHKSPDGHLHGEYSYIDGHGEIQHVKYVAGPHSGFNVVAATNLPKGPEAGIAAPIAAASDFIYHGPHAHIVIGKDGVPIDTPEVQIARKKHLHALAEAKAATGGGFEHGFGGDFY
ncbi:cuticle protein 7-like [Phlebotomus argentipes]|uniref:cuticle protein 7-like n=1 Tax=Phlebotomus argentipes TaxID=94469 RepID=UPI0028931FB6|nr:cuticle protein 7-like [Phlebotomus argentipes]